MGLYKEFHYELLELSNKQEQIYPDAADAGIKVTGATDPVCLKVQELLKSEHMSGGLKQHRYFIDTTLFTQVDIVVNIPWESSDCPGFSRCSEWTISYIADVRRDVRFLSFKVKDAVVIDSDIY